MGQKRVIAVRGIAGYIELTSEAAIRGGAADFGRGAVVERNDDRIVQGPTAAVNSDPGAGRTDGGAESKAGLDQEAAGTLDILAVADREAVATEEQGRNFERAVEK